MFCPVAVSAAVVALAVEEEHAAFRVRLVVCCSFWESVCFDVVVANFQLDGVLFKVILVDVDEFVLKRLFSFFFVHFYENFGYWMFSIMIKKSMPSSICTIL